MTETSGASGHQKLRVCDVCGAYLSVLDSDRRLADHFGGKVRMISFSFVSRAHHVFFSQMHLGYHELRNMLSQFRAEREARKNAPPPPQASVPSTSLPPPGATVAPRANDRERDRDRGDYRGSRDREPGRDRGYDRDRYGSSRYE